MRLFAQLTLCVSVAAGLVACTNHAATPPPAVEDCQAPGDEDGNGLADCADPACFRAAGCQATCGNGAIDPGEACDDGNTVDGDGCDHNCMVTACSEGIVSGCACGQVAAGDGDSMPLPGQITKLSADPTRCIIYALNAGEPSELVVIDTERKAELVRVPLPELATDLDVSPSGNYLVVSHNQAISIIDPATWKVTLTLATRSDAYSVEIDDDGVAYYVQFYGNPGVRRFDLRTGVDTVVAGITEGDPELSSDGRFLYVGQSNTSGGALFKFDRSGEILTTVDQSTFRGGYGFSNPERHVYLSPGGQHAYYAGYQLDAGSLKFVSGRTFEKIYAEDGHGTFAIGASHVFDAKLVRPVAALPHGAMTAVLTPGDQELWYYSPETVRLYYVNPYDLIAGQALGVREIDPAPLASHTFTKLIHDPVRPRLYGLDTAQAVVVVIDTATQQPIREIRVGSTPTDLDIDPAGVTLFVGHLDALGFARIDLATLTFERFVFTPSNSFRVVALGAHRVVTNDDDQWTGATLTDATTGAVLSSAGSHEGALSATGDRTTLFLGDSGLSGSTMYRYAITGDRFVLVDRSDYDGGYGFPNPPRAVTALPDGSGVYYAGYLLDGNDLSVLRYPIAETILAVTADGRRALSSSSVYAVATGERLGALPVTTSALAISPDGARVYLAAGGAIISFDLGGF